MALRSSKLGNGISKIRQRGKGTAQQVASDWAREYADYAADALSPLAGKPVDLSASRSALEGILTTAFAGTAGPPATAAQIANGLAAFWLPVVFTGAFPGKVTLMGPPAVLTQALLVAWAANMAGQFPDSRCAENVAKAMDAWTRTVVVTHLTTPVPTIGPIT